MARELATFIERLFKRSDLFAQSRKPPLTYEAYANALQEELSTVKQALVEFEVDIMKQGISNHWISLFKLHSIAIVWGLLYCR